MIYLPPNKNFKSLDRTHKTGNKHQIIINTKKKTTKPKKATVSIEIRNNIVKALNEIESEMVEFTKIYHKQQQQITSGTTEIIKDIINPIAKESKKLKKTFTLHIKK